MEAEGEDLVGSARAISRGEGAAAPVGVLRTVYQRMVFCGARPSCVPRYPRRLATPRLAD